MAQVTQDIGDLELYQVETPDDFRRTAAWIEKAIALRRQQGTDQIEYRTNLHRLGLIHLHLDMPQEAMDLFRDCLNRHLEQETNISGIATF